MPKQAIAFYSGKALVLACSIMSILLAAAALEGQPPRPANDAPGKATGQQENDRQNPLAPYVGEWVGVGWGTEVRSRTSKSTFASQFQYSGKPWTADHGNRPLRVPNQKTDQPEKDGTLMSLTVEHATIFTVNVDESGTVTGRGAIAYDLLPNLCGVAALTKQVNDRVRLLELLPIIYALGSEVSKRAGERFAHKWHGEEEKLQQLEHEITRTSRNAKIRTSRRAVDQQNTVYVSRDGSLYVPKGTQSGGSTFTKDGAGSLYVKGGDGVYGPNETVFQGQKFIKDGSLYVPNADPRVQSWLNDGIYFSCASNSVALVGGAPCMALLSKPGPVLSPAQAGVDMKFKWLKDGAHAAVTGLQAALELHNEGLLHWLTDYLKEHHTSEKQEEALCMLAPEQARAGTKIGPSTPGEFIEEMKASVPAATIAFLASGLLDPSKFILSIPGRTQVQYYYKGLRNGPENRWFNIKGRLAMTSGGARIYVDMDGDVEGDKLLWTEYMVDFKKDQRSFPTWSPFLHTPGEIRDQGARSAAAQPPKTHGSLLSTVESKSGSKRPSVASDDKNAHSQAPSATFSESGVHRNGVKAWQEYDYHWSAIKVTEPVPR